MIECDTIPIAIFAFNRPEKLETLLKSLDQCPEFSHSEVYIFLDGPRHSADSAGVYEVRKIANSRRRTGLHIIELDINQGLKKSLMAGISYVLGRHECVVVLEDDLVVAPGALHYFHSALKKYEDVERVWSICGYAFDLGTEVSRRGAMFLPFCLPWGWATWRRAWNEFSEKDRVHFDQADSRSFRTAFDAGVRDFAEILDLDRRGEVSSWFINWYLEVFLHGGITLFPPAPLVTNAGMRGGTHASRFNPYGLLKRPAKMHIGSIDFPNEICIDFSELDRVGRSFDARLQKGISTMGRFKRSLRRLVKRLH